MLYQKEIDYKRRDITFKLKGVWYRIPFIILADVKVITIFYNVTGSENKKRTLNLGVRLQSIQNPIDEILVIILKNMKLFENILETCKLY